MPGLNGVAYQIGNWTTLKPELPGILKEFAKAAIRTNPNDIIQWQVAEIKFKDFEIQNTEHYIFFLIKKPHL